MLKICWKTTVNRGLALIETALTGDPLYIQFWTLFTNVFSLLKPLKFSDWILEKILLQHRWFNCIESVWLIFQCRFLFTILSAKQSMHANPASNCGTSCGSPIFNTAATWFPFSFCFSQKLIFFFVIYECKVYDIEYKQENLNLLYSITEYISWTNCF